MMLLALSKFELKNLLRDKMTGLMVLYPLLMAGIGKYLIDNQFVEDQALGITAMFLALIAGFMYGAMAGFSLLDDRDDQVFASIQISQMSLTYYIWFKVAFAYFFATISGFFIIWFTGVIPLSSIDILLISLLSALQTPITAFLVNAFANNKVEGFITMKATGFLLLFPVGGFFFLDGLEWLFAIAPAHWPAKAVQYALLKPHIDAGFMSMNLSFHQYIFIGIAYNMLLVLAAYKIFNNKNNL
jgi:fluoroquinolone transport system permease protein